MELEVVIIAQIAVGLMLCLPAMLALGAGSGLARGKHRRNRSPYTASARGKFEMFGPSDRA